MSNRHQSAANRARAPLTAEFVEAIRRFDPLCKVLYVSDGAVQLGVEPDYGAYHRVHAGMLGSVDDYIAEQARKQK